jgi:hypothetical protein
MFVTHRPRGPNPQVKEAHGPVGRPHFKSAWAGTWWLRSHVGLEEDPIPESQWKLEGVAGQPHGGSSGCPSPPN